MAAYSRLPIPFMHPVNGSGVPYPGAKAYFYVAGTTTPLDTYSDLNLSVPNANPVLADANGLFGPIFLGSGTYDVVLKTSADATIWTAEDVAAAAITSATTTVAGIIELATTAEALTGTSTTLGMTPATVVAAIQQGFSYGTTGGSANAITVTPSILPSALASGMVMYFRASSTNTAATTINFAALGAVSARVMGASGVTACNGGEIIANNLYRGTYSGSDSAWVIEQIGWVPAAINALTAETALAAGDKFLMYDISGLVPKSITPSVMAATEADQEAASSSSLFVTPLRQHFHTSAAKVWASADVTAGVPAAGGSESFNLTSVGDTGGGRALFTIATDFTTATWAAIPGLESNDTGVLSAGGSASLIHLEGSKAAGTAALRTTASEGTVIEPTSYSLVGFGTN